MIAVTVVDDMMRHVERASWHLAQARALADSLPDDTVITSDGALKAIRCAGKGWLTHNRCPEADTPNSTVDLGHIGASPHAAHSYGRNNGQWCDGYI